MFYRRDRLVCPSKHEGKTLKCVNCGMEYKPVRYGEQPQEVDYNCPKCKVCCYKIKKVPSWWDIK